MMFILWMIFWYILIGLGFYVYAVVKSWEILGFWNLEISERLVGMMEYPKWLLGWLYWIVKRVRGLK